MQEHEIKELLLQKDEEFKRLFAQHQNYEKILESYKAKLFLTETERREEQEIKKKKLAIKDRLYVLIAQFKTARDGRNGV